MNKQEMNALNNLRHWERHKTIYISAAITLLSFLLLMFALDPVVLLLDRSSIKESNQNASKSLAAELDYLRNNIRDLAKSESIALYLESGDDANLLAYTLTEASARKLGGILVADRNGVVRSRTINPLIRGDLIFESTPWGREVRGGREVFSFEAGRTVPLVMIAGAPIRKDNENIGSIFAAHNLTDAYAREFRDKHLPSRAEIIFVDRSRGMVGASFESSEAREVLETHIATALPGNDHEISWPWRSRIQLREQEYLVGALPLKDLEGNTNYALVFTPTNSLTLAIFLAGLVFLLFVALEIKSHEKFRSAGKRHLTSLLLFGGAIFFLALFTVSALLSGSVTRLAHLPQTIYNSVIGLHPESMVFGESFEQRINIVVTTSGEAVNAVEAELFYDPEKVEITEIITEKSICPESFFLEREIDVEMEVIKISCLIPKEGFIGQGILAELIAKPLKPGTFSLKFGENTKVLAHDGLGTDVLRAMANGSYQSVALDSIPFVIHSPTHPNQERWYSNASVNMIWSDAENSGEFSYYLDEEDKTLTGENSAKLDALSDGTHYFHLSTGDTLVYKLNIDSTPPDRPLIKASETEIEVGDLVRFELSSADRGSGLQSTFYFQVDGGILLPVRRELSMPFYERGRHTITIKAFDLAGNSSESSLVVNVRQ
jgi:hypothetical protein